MPIAPQVCGHGSLYAIHGGYRMVHEGEPALILQPTDPVIGFQQIRWIEGIAVGEQNVEIAVAVEIDQLNAARAKGGMRSGVDHFFAEVSAALVQESHHRFMLLADQ